MTIALELEAYVKCPTKCWLISKHEPISDSGHAEWVQAVIDHLNPRFLNFKRKIDKETSVIFCAVGTELSSFIPLL